MAISRKADTRIAACLKHFAGYGAVNAGRDYNDVEISPADISGTVCKPFPYGTKSKPAMVADSLMRLTVNR